MRPATSALCLALATALRAQLITNGGFEAPFLTSTQNISGAFTLAGWTGVASSSGGNAGLVVGTDNNLSPASGRQHYTFNGGNPSDQGYIQQTITTTPGQEYSLTFAIGRAGAGQNLSLTAAALADTTTLALGNYQPPAGNNYATATLSFVASTHATTIRFTDTSGGNSISDLYIDDVAVSAIPEPATTALLMATLALLYAHRRRK
jgi:hypothetical protein